MIYTHQKIDYGHVIDSNITKRHLAVLDFTQAFFIAKKKILFCLVCQTTFSSIATKKLFFSVMSYNVHIALVLVRTGVTIVVE